MKIHFSLPVTDIVRTTRFYSSLFACKPSKEKGDYVKFEPEHLALNVSFHLGNPEYRPHLGLQVSSVEQLMAEQERLRSWISQDRERSVCCYALQDKFWVRDPDGYEWEIYLLMENTEQKIDRASTCCLGAEGAPCC